MKTVVLFWGLTILFCSVFIFISLKTKSKASESFSEYAIGGGNFPFLLLFFTYFATVMGAGNFFGHAGNTYVYGLPWLAYILGEQGSKILFALIFAGMGGRFSYNTLPEMLDDIVVHDKVTRGISAVLVSILLIAMIGAQSKALGQIFTQFTGMSATPIIILFSVVFIAYTCFGGIYSVIWTDLFQGILCCVFAIVFYVFAFKRVDFSLTVLGERLAELGKAELWSFASVSKASIFNKFLTGCIGILVSQVIWQRCFCSKNAKESRNSLLFSGIICIIFTVLTSLVGLVIMTLNQDLDANTAMTWFMYNGMPLGLAMIIFLLVLCAGMSTADSALNSCSVVIVNDLIHPLLPDLTDQQQVVWAKSVTVVVGALSCLAAIWAPSIYGLIAGSNTVAASALFPVVCIGLFWKKQKGAHAMGICNSKVTPWGARVSLIVGFVVAMIPVFGDTATVWAAAAGSVALIIVSLLTADEKKQRT